MRMRAALFSRSLLAALAVDLAGGASARFFSRTPGHAAQITRTPAQLVPPAGPPVLPGAAFVRPAFPSERAVARDEGAGWGELALRASFVALVGGVLGRRSKRRTANVAAAAGKSAVARIDLRSGARAASMAAPVLGSPRLGIGGSASPVRSGELRSCENAGYARGGASRLPRTAREPGS